MRILVVEDEENLSAALSKGLGAEGFEVDVAADGTTGVQLARSRAYDVIILDILLPGTNGFRVCAILREEGIWTPILMLTAKHGELDEAEALDTGADDFLTKPFSFVVLLARIRALMRRGRPENPTVLMMGDLRLDLSQHRCLRGEVEIELTPREFALLEYLLRFQGEALDKRDILTNVWGEEFEGDPNIVEVYMGYLRRKVDQAFGRANLQTVRGIGYRLAPDGD